MSHHSREPVGPSSAQPPMEDPGHRPPSIRAVIAELRSPREEHAASFVQEWAGPRDTLSEENVLWRQYLVLVDLYKYYLDVVWKVSVWYYAVAGALLAYYFQHVVDHNPYLKWLLPFIVVVSWALSLLHWRALPQLMQLRDWLEWIALQLKLPGRPHVEFAAAFVLLNAILLLLAGAAVLVPFILAPW